MATSKKDYIALSAILKAEGDKIRNAGMDEGAPIITANEVISRMAYRMADYFVGDNPAFNLNRFLKACGVINE